MAKQHLNLLKLAASGPAQLRARATQVVGCDPRQPDRRSLPCSVCQTTFSDSAAPWTQSPRFTGRKTCPSAISAVVVHASTATFVHVGAGHRPNSAVFALHVNDAPATVPLLEVRER